MPYPIRITDVHEHNHLYETHADEFPCEDDREPVIVFLKGDAAYRFVSDSDRAGYGDIDKLKKAFNLVMDRAEIELPVLHSNHLEKGRFQIFDGRHRATIFMLRDEVIQCGHYGPTLDAESYDLAPTPFLTLSVIARKLLSMGYLAEPSAAFDTTLCRATVFTP